MSTKSECMVCRKPNATLNCGICETDLCKNCIEKAPDEAFAMLTVKPEILNHTGYCPNCFDDEISPKIEEYAALLERARNVGIWTKAYKGNVPVVKKARDPIAVEGAEDKDDLFMKIGFAAAEQGFNGLIRVEVNYKKLQFDKGQKYQKMVWSATGHPVLVDEAKLAREEFHEAHWRVLSHR